VARDELRSRQRGRYIVETLAVPSSDGMIEPPRVAAQQATSWRPLALLLIACLAMLAWSAYQIRPTLPTKRAPAQAPAKQLPKQRTNPTGEPEPVC
jgi:hypothetical protein